MWVLIQDKNISRLSFWSGAARNLCGNRDGISLYGRKKASANRIGSSLRRRRSHAATVKPSIRLTVVLLLSLTVNCLSLWSRAVRDLYRSVRKKPRYSVWKILVGRSVPHPHGSWISETPSAGAHPHCLLKPGSGPQASQRGRPFPMASTGARRSARKQKL